MADAEHRVERDSLGEVHVPKDARYQAQTQRAVENFPYNASEVGRRPPQPPWPCFALRARSGAST